MADNMLPHGNIYIKQFPSYYREEHLYQLCSPCGEVDSVRLCPAQPANLRPPHAFVRFKKVEGAAQAIATLNGTLLEGQTLLVKLADADVVPRVQSGSNPSEWVYCRALPAHYGSDDVIALFSPYGNVIDIKV
jgi:RNA recognition motif-containing protein